MLVLYRFRDIITNLPQFKEFMNCVCEHTAFEDNRYD